MTPISWLIIFVVLLGIEIATMALTTIWFAAGALVAFIFSLLGAGIELQLAVFVVVSFAVLVLIRPFAKKYVNKGVTMTNVDGLIGKKAQITEKVDNSRGSGAAAGRNQAAGSSAGSAARQSAAESAARSQKACARADGICL